jgi:hypothetical protein
MLEYMIGRPNRKTWWGRLRPKTAKTCTSTWIGKTFDSDAVFGVKKSLLAGFKRVNDPERARKLGFAGEFWEVEYDFVLAPAGDRMRPA